MRQELFDNNYIILEEFVPRDHARSLAEKFKVDCERENLPGDAQAENSHSIYNYKPALEILCNSTNRVSEVIDEPVLPTYNSKDVSNRVKETGRIKTGPLLDPFFKQSKGYDSVGTEDYRWDLDSPLIRENVEVFQKGGQLKNIVAESFQKSILLTKYNC